MFDASAEYYDLLYSTFKDYAAETAAIAALLRRLNPECRTVLDVACGTGEHAKRLDAEGFAVDGLDLSPAFVAIARAKHPAGRFFVADMTDFHVPQRYDAILCLFSSIGYVRTLDRVEAALRCFKDHLAPRGVILVEPWFPPGVLDTTRVFVTARSRTASASIAPRTTRSPDASRGCTSTTTSPTRAARATPAKSTNWDCSRRMTCWVRFARRDSRSSTIRRV